jgi:hypothetical protein
MGRKEFSYRTIHINYILHFETLCVPLCSFVFKWISFLPQSNIKAFTKAHKGAMFSITIIVTFEFEVFIKSKPK